MEKYGQNADLIKNKLIEERKMKKRITGLILVLVMLTLSLVGCGYSFAKDDLTAYATFSKKAEFENALKEIIIENGEFTTDADTRKAQVWDNIYASLANSADKEDKKTTGTPKVRDLAYYAYYATADFDGVTAVLFANYMNTSSAVSVQVGLSTYGEDEVSGIVAEKLGAYNFGNGVYKSNLTGTAKEGDKVFVGYKESYTVEVDGVATEKTVTHTNELMTVGAPVAADAVAANLESYLAGKSVGVTIPKVTIAVEGKGEVTYDSIKIAFVAEGVQVTEFKDVTYTEEKKVNDTTGTERDLNGKELTYHIYPVHYISVPEYNATNIIEVMFGENLSADGIYEIIFGEEFAGLDEKEDKDKIAERAELLANYKTADGKTIENLVATIIELYTDIENAEKALEEADKNVSDAESNIISLKAELTAAQNPGEGQEVNSDKVAAIEDDIEKAENTLETAKGKQTEAQTLVDTKKTEKANTVQALIGITAKDKTLGKELEDGYEVMTYDYLQENYNEEIRMNLAKEIYYFMNEYVEVTGVPEDAVDATYERLIENYEYNFYEGKASDNKTTNYKKYDGSFKKYLVAAVTTDIKTVETYDEALAAIREKAEEYVKPIVMIYVVSKAYDVVATDKEFEEYTKDTDNNYSYNEYYYGENSVRYAFQFDKLMNYFLAFEEVESEPTAEGYVFVEYKYTNEMFGGYKFGEPASEKAEKTEE